MLQGRSRFFAAAYELRQSRKRSVLANVTLQHIGSRRDRNGDLKALEGRLHFDDLGICRGPGDGTDRFTYWPSRLVRGGGSRLATERWSIPNSSGRLPTF